MKKVISLIAASALLIGSAPLLTASAAEVTACEFVLTPDKPFVHPGETVTYTFSIIPNGDVYALQAYSELPEGLTLVANSAKLTDEAEQLGWDDVDVTEGDKLLFSGFTAKNPYTKAEELKFATFACTVTAAGKAPSLSDFFVVNKEIKIPEKITADFQPVNFPALKKVDAKPSTCREHGNNEYYICEDNCGLAYKDAEGKTETTAEAETLPLTDHKYTSETISADYLTSPANCVSPAVYYKRCVSCGEKSTETFTHGEKDPDRHTGNNELRNAVKATESQEGYTGDTYCKDCDELIKRGEVIPKLTPSTPDKPDTPSTPDTPDTPGTPDTPDTPSTPDTPDTPSTPDTPDTPSTPDIPDTPNMPDTPDTPSTPNTSDTPVTNKGSIIIAAQTGENVPKMEITTSTDILEEIILTDAERELYNSGYNVSLTLTADNIDSSISADDKALISDTLTALGDHNVGQYYELKLHKVISGTRKQILAMGKPITVTAGIPSSLRRENREFKLIRIHDGKASVLNDLDYASDTVTFESDLFSVYALIYHDREAGETDIPYTGVVSPLPILATVGAVTLLVCVVLFFTTGKNGLSEEKKERTFTRLIAWGKRGGKIRGVVALALISLLLVYYYGIGMKTADKK